MAELFGKMIEKNISSTDQTLSNDDAAKGIENTVKKLMESDVELISRGEIPERRLIPHHAIKRDIIISAYNKDFQVAINQLNQMNWLENEKAKKIIEIEKDFDEQIRKIKRLEQDDLDKIITIMKQTRTDLMKIEKEVRSENAIYKIVDPII